MFWSRSGSGLVSYLQLRSTTWWPSLPTRSSTRSQTGSWTGRRTTRTASTPKLSPMPLTWSSGTISSVSRRSGKLNTDLDHYINCVLLGFELNGICNGCFVFYYNAQEPPWAETLLGSPCPRTAHQDNRSQRKDRWCLKEALSKPHVASYCCFIGYASYEPALIYVSASN